MMRNGNVKQTEIVAATFETAAVLYCAGFRFLRGEQTERRVLLVFEDNAQHEGEKLLQRHACEGVEINSSRFVAALSWAKNTVFGIKDGR